MQSFIFIFCKNILYLVANADKVAFYQSIKFLTFALHKKAFIPKYQLSICRFLLSIICPIWFILLFCRLDIYLQYKMLNLHTLVQFKQNLTFLSTVYLQINIRMYRQVSIFQKHVGQFSFLFLILNFFYMCLQQKRIVYKVSMHWYIALWYLFCFFWQLLNKPNLIPRY